MNFFPVLRDAHDNVFLFHVEADSKMLKAAVLVVNPYMNHLWLKLSTGQGLSGDILEVQMPPEIIGQPERYKGYDLNLPYKAKS